MPDLPDLTITIPGGLRSPLAGALQPSRDPASLRLAADLLDPELHVAGLASRVELTDDEQRVASGMGGQVRYEDEDGDMLDIVPSSFAAGHLMGTVHAAGRVGKTVRLGLEHQQRLHALLTANLAKHGAL